jgi:pimeloyl-ACP methyl ester carboxylesterase
MSTHPAHRHDAETASDAIDRFLTVGADRVAYRVIGRDDHPVLLLLQRFRGTMDEWDPLFLDALARGRRVIVFDSPGVGASTGTVPPSIEGMAARAWELVDALGLGELDVLGWSMGGTVAQRMALMRPHGVRRLVIAASGPGGVADAPPPPARALQVSVKPANDDDDFLYLFYAESEASRRAGRASQARIARRLRQSRSVVSGDNVRQQLAAIKAWTEGRDAARPRLGEIAIPTLVASGARDIMVHPYSTFVLSQELPNAELILYADAGHAFLFQHAEAFAQRVLAFLD